MFICCVAVNAPDSIHSVEKWASEIRTVIPGAPIVLVLCKKDLQELVDDPITEAMVRDKKKTMAL